MLWHRTVKKDGSAKWIAVGADGKPVTDENGFYWTRYESSVGAPVYRSKKKNQPDKDFQPEELPDGSDANSREGIIRRFCFTPEAEKDWAFLDAWKRRKYTSVTHAGCGDGSWPEVSDTVPLTCPNCGPLKGDENLYAQWQTVKENGGEGVKACVYEAWLTGKRFEYMAGKHPPVVTITQKEVPSTALVSMQTPSPPTRVEQPAMKVEPAWTPGLLRPDTKGKPSYLSDEPLFQAPAKTDSNLYLILAFVAVAVLIIVLIIVLSQS